MDVCTSVFFFLVLYPRGRALLAGSSFAFEMAHKAGDALMLKSFDIFTVPKMLGLGNARREG